MAFLEADGRSGLHPDRGGTRRRLHELASEEPKLQPLLDTAQPRQPESIHPRPLQVCVATNPDPLCQKTISQGGRAADRVRTNDSWFNPCAFTSPRGRSGISDAMCCEAPASITWTCRCSGRFASGRRKSYSCAARPSTSSTL